MKVPEDHVMCELCRDIIPRTDSKRFVAYIEWGSFSGTNHYGVCCKVHPTDSNDYPLGEYKRTYA